MEATLTRSLSVLVVDDNPDAADALALLLREAGHRVEVAWDGLAALAAAPELRPDVIFLDLGMPGMNGYEAARRLKEHPAAASAVLVALTGWGTEDDRRRTRAAGFARHLVKPADPADVLACVEQVAGERAAVAG